MRGQSAKIELGKSLECLEYNGCNQAPCRPTGPSGHGRTGLKSDTAKHVFGRNNFLLTKRHFMFSVFYGRTTFSPFNTISLFKT